MMKISQNMTNSMMLFSKHGSIITVLWENNSRFDVFFYTVDATYILIPNSLGKISYTSDIWSSKSRTPYLAITAHWMCQDKGGNICLTSALIAFHRVWGKHTAKNLSKIMLDLFDRTQSTNKASWSFNIFYCFIFCRLIFMADWSYYTW